jgi:hypothetical protein
MFAFPNVFHFFAHKLTRLGGRRFAFALVFVRAFDCFFFWHNKIISPLATLLDVTNEGLPLGEDTAKALLEFRR